MEGDFKAKFFKAVLAFNKVFLYRVANIETFGILCKLGRKNLKNGLLKFIMLTWTEGEILTINFNGQFLHSFL